MLFIPDKGKLSVNIQEWGRADLHMHTTISDGLASVREVLDHIERQGRLDVVAISDHDRLEGSLWAYENRARYSFEIIPSVEISSAVGHILGLWVTRPIPANLSLEETVSAIHEQGGLAVLAHPFHVQMSCVAPHAVKYLRNPHLLVEAGLDGLEVHNAGVLLPFCNVFARRFARQLDLASLGNSDAHTLGAIGSGVTRFAGKTADDLRHAILNRQTIAQGGVWSRKEYRLFIRDLIARRGKIPTTADIESLLDIAPNENVDIVTES